MSRTFLLILLSSAWIGRPAGAVPLGGEEGASPWPTAGAPICGLCSVYIAARVLDHPVSIARLVDPQYLSSHRGSSLRDVRRAAEAIGLNAMVVERMSVADLRWVRSPVILHVKSSAAQEVPDHYVVFLPGSASDQDALIFDPSNGMHRMTYREVASKWFGRCVIVAKGELTAVGYASAIRVIAIVAVIIAGLVVNIRLTPSTPFGQSVASTIAAALRQGIGITVAIVLVAGVHAVTADGGLVVQGHAAREIEHFHTDAFIPRIEHEEAFALLSNTDEERRAIAVDVRSLAQFETGHLPGAISLPFTELQSERMNAARAKTRDRVIIVYCSDEHCALSRLGARELRRAGWRNLRVFEGGVAAWKRAGYSLETGGR